MACGLLQRTRLRETLARLQAEKYFLPRTRRGKKLISYLRVCGRELCEANMNISETAAFLKTLDRVLILTHVRPDGDTVGSAAALCQALRDLGKEAFLLYNPEITATYAPYAAPYWADEGFTQIGRASCRERV